MRTTLTISPTGLITCLGNPLDLPGVIKTQRWSVIKPVNPLLRLLFNTVRYCFGDRGRWAAWSRTWRVTWRATVLSTKATFTHEDRQACVDWEHEQYYQTRIDL